MGDVRQFLDDNPRSIVTSKNSGGDMIKRVSHLSIQALPKGLGVCLNLAYPTDNIRRRHSLGRSLPLNLFVDVILAVVWNGTPPRSPTSKSTRASTPQSRKLVFTSSVPDVCVAVNWKQPNCACVPSLPHLLIIMQSPCCTLPRIVACRSKSVQMTLHALAWIGLSCFPKPITFSAFSWTHLS